MNTLLCLNLTNVLLSAVSGFIDSIRVFKKAFPEKNNYQQETLVKTILKTTYGAHDAIEDIKTLVMLLKQTKFSGSDLLSFSFPPLAVHHSLLFGMEKSKNITLLHVFIANGIVKHNTTENIADSGLTYSHLYKIFKRDWEDGLRAAFSQNNCDGQPQVSSTKRVLNSAVPELVEYFEKHEQ